MTRTLWLSVFALVLSVMVYYALGYSTGKWLADSLVTGVAAGMSFTWFAAAMRAMRRGAGDGTAKIVLTVWLAWTIYLVQRVYVLILAALGRPQWLSESFVPQLIATVIFLAGAYGLSAPVSGAEELPRREMAVLLVGWFVAGIVGGGAAMYWLLNN